MKTTIDSLISQLQDAKRRVSGDTPVFAWVKDTEADQEYYGIDVTYDDGGLVLELQFDAED